MKVEAKILITKCDKYGKLYGVRTKRRNNDWIRTWAFPIKENYALLYLKMNYNTS